MGSSLLLMGVTGGRLESDTFGRDERVLMFLLWVSGESVVQIIFILPNSDEPKCLQKKEMNTPSKFSDLLCLFLPLAKLQEAKFVPNKSFHLVD